jgi:hypothetical protein
MINTEYVSIEKQILLDAQKYIERAETYLNSKQYGHCAGCLAKAAKKITNAQHIYNITSNEGLNLLLRAMCDKFAKNVADKLLNS